MNLLWVTHRQY